jgi:pyrimidine operon attenuation protein/uracil phosphoribosyltransferase
MNFPVHIAEPTYWHNGSIVRIADADNLILVEIVNGGRALAELIVKELNHARTNVGVAGCNSRDDRDA